MTDQLFYSLLSSSLQAIIILGGGFAFFSRFFERLEKRLSTLEKGSATTEIVLNKVEGGLKDLERSVSDVRVLSNQIEDLRQRLDRHILRMGTEQDSVVIRVENLEERVGDMRVEQARYHPEER